MLTIRVEALNSRVTAREKKCNCSRPKPCKTYRQYGGGGAHTVPNSESSIAFRPCRPKYPYDYWKAGPDYPLVDLVPMAELELFTGIDCFQTPFG